MTISLVGMMSFPVHPTDWKRPKGNTDYRVTGTFDGLDLVNGGPHNATDIGNFRSGDPIRAPTGCQARGLKHTDGALGVEFALGGVTTVETWHLSKLSIPLTWTPVAEGQIAGLTGNSGALVNGRQMPKHTHVELKRDGLRFDPEPYLLGAPLSVEEPMQLKGTFLRHVVNSEGRLTSESNFRSGVLPGDDAPIGVLPLNSLILPVAVVEGRAVGTAPDRAEWFFAIKSAIPGVSGTHGGYVHSSVLPRTSDGRGVQLTLIQKADCTSEQNRINRALTAARGAAQANQAVINALEP